MANPIHILLQTTIPAIEDDWNIERFSLLRDQLASTKDEHGVPLYKVTTRDREVDSDGNDVVLSVLDQTYIIWLITTGTRRKVVPAFSPNLPAMRSNATPRDSRI